jgi:hypothetical protein
VQGLSGFGRFFVICVGRFEIRKNGAPRSHFILISPLVTTMMKGA